MLINFIAIMYSRHLFIKTNQSCNLNCVYCYEKEKNSSVFVVSDVFKKVIELLRVPTTYGTKIKLIGGEPFLAFDQIKSFCELIWSAEIDEKVHIQITTNGTLVHGEVQEWLREHKFDIDCKLSLDGDKLSQDLNRPNSFERIDIPFFSNNWEDCIVNMVVMPNTMPYFAHNIIFLHNCGFNKIVPIFAVLTNWNQLNLQKIYYEQLTILAEYYMVHPNIKRCRTLSLHLERLLDSCDCILCDIGKKTIYDVNSEKYYPCHLFFPSVCGDNHPKDMELIDFSIRSKFEHDHCLHCKFINLCHTCYAANYIERGNLGNRDMSICSYRKIDFLVNAKLEYNRILCANKVSNTDIQIMKAIKEIQPELEAIEKDYLTP